MSTILEESKSNSLNSYFVRAYRASHELHYGYMVTMSLGGEIHELKCEYLIKCIGQNKETNNNIYQVVRTPVFINDQEPDTLAEELAAKIGAVIYPLQLETNAQGFAIKIQNHGEIMKRWNTLKADLLEYYEGEVFLKYIQLSEQSLLVEEIMLEKLRQDWFLCTYFAPILGSYQKTIQKRNYLELPIGQNHIPIRYLTAWDLNTQLDKHGEIDLKALGEISLDEQNLLDEDALPRDTKEDKAKVASGTYTASYKLNAQTHVIQSINCVCDCLSDTDQSVKVDIYNIGQDASQQENSHGAIVVVDRWGEKKGGFWNKIFKS